MISLALTIWSGMFLTGIATTIAFVIYVVTGTIIRGIWELCKFYWVETRSYIREVSKQWKKH